MIQRKNMKNFGVVSLDTPSGINIYADTFEDKDKISEIIESDYIIDLDKKLDSIKDSNDFNLTLDSIIKDYIKDIINSAINCTTLDGV